MKYVFGSIFVVSALALMGYSIYSLVVTIKEHHKKKKENKEVENK